MELPTVQCIPPVMPRAVGDEGDETGVGLLGFAGLLGEGVEEQVNEADVAQLVAPADVVDLPGGTPAQDGVNGAAIVFDVQPVTDVEAVTIDGDGLPASAFLMVSGMSFSGYWRGP